MLRATTACTFSTSQLPKVVRTWCVLYILTWKCASRHNGVHFFDISTSKSGPNLVCFVHFDLEMCFAPQRRALFRHLNFQKVVRTWCVLYILTSKCASRHNGVQLFISHLPRCLRTRRFSEPTFQPSGATKPRKNTVFRDFPTFSRTCIFFLLIFSLLTLLPADCFFISPYCRKFVTSKLPSNMHLFRAKTFLCRPSSRTQTFRYRSIKQNKRFCYRLSKQNKTTLRTMSSNFLQSTDPSTGNVTFSGLEP